MANVTAKDCVKAVKMAAFQDSITDDQAKLLLSDIRERAKNRANQKFIKETDAIREISDEMIASDKFEVLRKKRNALRNVQATRELRAYAQANGFGFGVEQFLNKAYNEFIGFKTLQEVSYFQKVEAAGLMDVIHKRDAGFNLAFVSELRNLSMKEKAEPGGVSGNADAKKLADIWHAQNKELIAAVNMRGGAVKEAEGYSVPQTHLKEKLLAAEKRQFGGRTEQGRNYKMWRASLDEAGVKIDWERMDLGGQDREKWLREFHKSIYTRVFNRPDEIDWSEGGGSSSLADKLSQERKLWFADAESEFAYMQLWGHADPFDATVARIRQASRAVAIMKNLGPDPERVLKAARANLAGDAAQLEDSNKVIAGLESKTLDRMWESLSGRADSPTNPTIARLTDFAKSFTLLSKGTRFAVAAFGDKMAMQTAMRFHGLTGLESMRMQLEAIRLRDKQGSGRALRDIYAVTQAYIQETSLTHRDQRLALGSQLLGRVNNLTELQFKYTGFTGVTDMHHRAPAYAYSRMLGDEAANDFASIRPEMKRDFALHGINEAEWNAWRKTVTRGDEIGAPDNDAWVTPDRIADISESDWKAILKSRDENDTPSARRRVKANMEMNVRGLFNDIISDANNDPTLRVRSIRNLVSGGRGTMAREAWEMLLMFKSYPLTQLDRHLNREYNRTGATNFGDYVRNNPASAMMKASELVAKSIVAGMVVIWINDILSGKTPKAIIDENGEINGKVLLAAAQRGGGLGIYGDFLFGEYDKRYQNPLETAAGPILGQLPNLLAFKSDIVNGDNYGYKALNFIQANSPIINLPLIKPTLDHLIFFQMQEALNPGVHARRAAEMRRLGYQDYIPLVPTPEESVAKDPLRVQGIFN